VLASHSPLIERSTIIKLEVIGVASRKEMK